jgi:peptidoglycan/LPS O-acetylase OafA/YrhL
LKTLATPSNPLDLPSRLISLDVVRGIAAVSVVFWHWHHFWYRGRSLVAFEPESQPFWRYTSILYTNGWRAVDLFFCLSGFVFCWLYSERIAKKAVSLSNFTILRLSRLYPLHLLTLTVVVAGQWGYYLKHGDFLLPYIIDAKHLLLQFLFASDWGFEEGHSFNGPIWSVSVEVLLYMTFFMVCRTGRKKVYFFICLTILGLFALESGHTSTGRGLLSFYLGCLTFSGLRWARSRVSDTRLLVFCIPLAISFWGIGLFSITISENAYRDLWIPIRQNFAHWMERDFVGYLLMMWPTWFKAAPFFEIMVFPITIATLVLLELRLGNWWVGPKILGDISYSIYLIHYPLQLLILLLVPEVSKLLLYTHAWFLVAFFAVLFGISLLSHRLFEMPVQKFIRGLPIFSMSKVRDKND